LKEILKQQEELQDEYYKINFDSSHCKVCGDTKPKHNFYPLMGGTFGHGVYTTSGLMCNRCARTDEDYLKIFKEPKETINP